MRRMGVLDHAVHSRLLRIVGFRNILVHDYLNIDDVVVSAIVRKREYVFLVDVLSMLTAYLNSGDASANS